MLRPFPILSFVGLGAALSSGCDRGNDVVDAQHRSGATLEPTVHASRPLRGCTATATCPNGGNPEESGGVCAGS